MLLKAQLPPRRMLKYHNIYIFEGIYTPSKEIGGHGYMDKNNKYHSTILDLMDITDLWTFTDLSAPSPYPISLLSLRALVS